MRITGNFMKKVAIATGAATKVIISMNTFVQDFEINVSGTKQSIMSYGQPLIYYTLMNTDSDIY